MLKRLMATLLAISLVLGISVTSLADHDYNIIVDLNGVKTLLQDEVYFNEKGQLMCPLREMAEKLGYEVIWHEDGTIEVLKGDYLVQLKVGKKNVVVNGQEMNMSTMPIIKSGKTFVPVEFFDNALDLIVGWNNKYNSLTIRQPKINQEVYFKLSEDKSITEKLNTYMEALQKNRNFHGSLLVAKDGEILLDKGYGFADFQQNITNKSQTRFAIGSITKQFIAMAIMQLYEEGLLDVEDEISKYFPELPYGDSITIHNLLTHTSGLADFTNVTEFYFLDSNNSNPERVVDLIKDMPLEFQPGERYSYSNTNYLLLGMIIEKVSAMTYEEYLEENIFEPLNMKDTGINYGKYNQIHDATAYAGYLDVVPVDDEVLLRNAYGAGSMYSTVEDLYRWDRALYTEELVKKETLDKIFSGYVDTQEGSKYGYGWVIVDTGLGKLIYHTGGTLGFSAIIARFVDQDFTIIALVNSQGYNAVDLVNTIAAIVYNVDYKLPEALEEIEIEDTTLYDKYVGEYELAPGIIITITRDEKGIYAQVTGQDKYQIYPKSEKEYFYKIVDAQITFVENEEGLVTGLILHQLGQEIKATKIK